MPHFKVSLKQAELASRKGEIPIGAVIVKDKKIIARAHNQTEARGRFTAHAEIQCIEKATKKLKTKYLTGCTLYVTLEPCRMCRTAAQLSRIDQIFYLTKSQAFGSKGRAYFKTKIRKTLSPLHGEALELLQSFFSKKRQKPKTVA